MALRVTPPGEDGTRGARARGTPALVDAMPPGEDHVTGEGPAREVYNENTNAPQGGKNTLTGDASAASLLKVVSEAEDQALLYTNQANRRAWSDALKAYHNEHYNGSKYNKAEWRNRSKLYVPKTRSAVRKDMAAVAASLFGSVDAVNCSAGNESDPRQRAAAAVMEELINYRTDRTSGKASLPWFLVAMGARQDALLTGVCLSKQYWKLELKKGPDGKWRPDIDRPDVHLFPPENYVIDPAADWTNPAQTAAFLILKYPMRVDEIERKQEHPIAQLRWKKVSKEILDTSLETAKYDQAAIRRAREGGLDRYDETQTGYKFKVIWVFECFVRVNGEDWHFWSVGDKAYLTDPTPVEQVYPEQFGERPVVKGYGALDSHRIFPMSPVDSWRPIQTEINDIRNLALDQVKQNVMPITKVARGKQIDVEQVRRRSHGSAIIVTDKDDVTWETPPPLPNSVPLMNRDLELEFDDLAGQFNGGTTENNNALSRTLGGLKLVAGSANAVQEFDIRVWITTWGDPVLAQLVRLEQYYESDPIVLGLCGERAQLFEKYGVSQIDDDLLEQEVTIRVSIGLGAGDPQARLAKFQAATQIAAPLLAQSPEFQDGTYQIDPEAVMQEVYGAAGYRDGGMRFLKKGQPKPNPLGNLPIQKLQADIEKAKAQGRAALMTGLASLAKVELGNRELEAENADALLGRQLDAHDMGVRHAHDMHDRLLNALDHGHRHGLALRQHDLDERQHAAGVQQNDQSFGLGAAKQGLAERQHEHQATQDRAQLAQSADRDAWERDHSDREMEMRAAQPQGGGGGGGAKKPPARAAVPAPAPRQQPAPQPQSSDVDQKLDALAQQVAQLTQVLAAVLQQQQPQRPSFPAQPYGGQ